MEKVYCCDRPTQDNSPLWAALMSKNESSPVETAALLNGGYGSNQMWNNPMMYLVWMWVMRYMNNGWGENAGAENFNSRAISQLQSTVDNNHNNDLAMEAIKGNTAAIANLANTLNVDYNTMSQAICGIKSAIEQVGGQIGYTSERVINAVNLGNQGILTQLQNCCCNTQKAILEMGYQGQLQAKDLQSSLLSRIDQLANGIQTGFAQIGFNDSQNTAAIINAGNANTQRILDAMCANQTQALRDLIAQKDRELQSASIVNQLRGTCGCN